ncbi:ATP-binding protein [Kaarinaea lacus]
MVLPRIRLKHVLFLTFTLIASLPVLILAVWVEQSALDKEIAAVKEKHLLVAHNLTGDLTRYIIDVESSFQLIARNLVSGNELEGVAKHLDSLYLRDICITNSRGIIQKLVTAASHIPIMEISQETLSLLTPIMKQAQSSMGKVFYSDMVRTGPNETMFYMVEALEKDLYVIGALSTNHVLEAQKKVTFGRRGHAAIVDRTGRAIAHPIPDWVKTSKDMSFLPPVKMMKQGATGVSQFFTPAMQADMVAGYTTVPRVGWGVMIPQPFEELEERANDVQMIALTIALSGITIAGLISWYIAGILSQPIQSVVDATQFNSEDKQNPLASKVSTTYRFIPHELRELLNAFNLMREKLNTATSQLYSKIDHANEEVKQQNEQLQDYSKKLLEANDKLEKEVIERRKAEDESALQSKRLRALYDATQLKDLTHDEKILSVLRLGCNFFNMEIGRVCEIDEEKNTNTIAHVIAPEEYNLPAGKVSDLDKTFCKFPFSSEELISIINVGRSKWKSEVCYQHSSLESYLATIIWVNGKKYGTLNFCSLSPRVNPFSDSDLDFLKIMAQWVGISMERRISMERENIRTAAEAASEAKGRFLANMSHELRTPINAILGYGELLIEECEEAGNIQMLKDLEKIKTAGTHLTKLISNILDLSKIEAGKIDVICSTHDIENIIDEVGDTARPLVSKNNNEFIIKTNDGIGDIYSDRTIVQQILLNLLSNAGKFTTNGKVTLEATSIDLDGKDHIMFTVSDNGIGMTEEQINIVFNEFSQANSPVSPHGGGIGLGLNISRRYCSLLNGRISAISKIDEGSQFCVILPRNFSEAAVSQVMENQG